MKELFRRGTAARLALVAFATFGFAGTAQADLIFDSFVANTGTGFGTQATILSLQDSSAPPDGTESGSVTMALGGLDVLTGDLNPVPHNQTQSLADLMVNSPEEFRLVFDAVEPRGNDNDEPFDTKSSITITELIVTFYTENGAFIISQSLVPVPVTYEETNAGNGIDDVVFRLDTKGVTDVKLAFAGISPIGSIRVGAAATLINAQGGPDSFSGSSVPTPPTPMPEPATLALLGIGLLGVGMSVRRRKQSQSF